MEFTLEVLWTGSLTLARVPAYRLWLEENLQRIGSSDKLSSRRIEK